MTATQIQPRILWAQVLCLAAVQGAIALMWVIYNLYLGRLLGQFGFSAVAVTVILLIENVLAMVMEPLMGTYSDRAQRWMGSRFPFISVGVILASGILIAIAALVIFGQPVGIVRWLLPILLVAWAVAMTIFRSPALSLLGRYAFGSGLPQAASALTVIGALVGSLGPLANEFILGLGPAIAFGLASLTLLGAAAVLRSVNPNVQVTVAQASNAAKPRVSMLNLVWVFLAGCGTALGFRLQMFAFPKFLATIPDVNVGLTMGTILLATAVTAIPGGKLASWLGNKRAMMLGLGGIAITLGLMNWVHHTVMAMGIAISLGSFLSLVRNGTLPFALSMVPVSKAGLGIGIFFSGGALASNLFGAIFKQPDVLTPATAILVSIGGWLLAMIAIASSRASTPPLP